MIHLLMAVFFSVCCLGLANSILAFLVYKRRNEKLYKYQFLFLTSVFLYSLSQFVAAYSFFMRLIPGYFIMPLFSNFLMSPLLYLAFSFAYRLAGARPSKTSNLLMIVWALSYPMVFIMWIWQHIMIFYTLIYAYSPFVIFLIILNILLHRYPEIVNPEIKKFIHNILVLILLSIPLIILEIFIDRYLQTALYYAYPVTQLFFMGFNLINLSFLVRVFLQSPYHTANSAPELPQWFYERYNLTKREQEVLSLLQQRYGNREIADRLFISIPTVKFHIQNIFLKIGVNNRVKLLRYLEEALIANPQEDSHP
jgi:DNA-binding CsgD family transcriptional regulator